MTKHNHSSHIKANHCFFICYYKYYLPQCSFLFMTVTFMETGSYFELTLFLDRCRLDTPNLVHMRESRLSGLGLV